MNGELCDDYDEFNNAQASQVYIHELQASLGSSGVLAGCLPSNTGESYNQSERID